MKAYRASNHTATPALTCFALCREDAEAYLDNPGFGGNTLYSAVLPFRRRDARVLDVSDLDSKTAQLRAVMEAGGMTEEQIDEEIFANASECVGDLHACCSQRRLVHAAFEQLTQRFDAVIFTDSYPDNCTTVMILVDMAVEMTDITPA